MAQKNFKYHNRKKRKNVKRRFNQIEDKNNKDFSNFPNYLLVFGVFVFTFKFFEYYNSY